MYCVSFDLKSGTVFNQPMQDRLGRIKSLLESETGTKVQNGAVILSAVPAEFRLPAS